MAAVDAGCSAAATAGTTPNQITVASGWRRGWRTGWTRDWSSAPASQDDLSAAVDYIAPASQLTVADYIDSASQLKVADYIASASQLKVAIHEKYDGLSPVAISVCVCVCSPRSQNTPDVQHSCQSQG